MKRVLILLVLFSAAWAVYWSVPIPRPGDNGFYTWNGTIWCTTRPTCIHEVGHALDDRAGWISNSPAFIAAMERYTTMRTRFANGEPDPVALKELYAYLYQGAKGEKRNMPIPFQKFYNWKLGHELMKEFVH